MDANSTPLTALDLLELLLLQQACTPRTDQWGLDNESLYPPEKRRLQQIAALCDRFVPELTGQALPQKARALLDGAFLRERDPTVYDSLLIRMQARLADVTMPPVYPSLMPMTSLCRAYTRLLRFKDLARQLQSFNSGLLEADFVLTHTYVLTRALSQTVNTDEIDQFLWTLIDPAQRSFSEAELITAYGYPLRDDSWEDEDWL